MDYYNLKLCSLSRKLPIVAIGPKLKIASFSLLGDGELVEKVAEKLVQIIKKFDFDYLVGPEVKVVPLLQALSTKLKKPRYVILRKNIMGYMTKPISTKTRFSLVLNGPDAELIKNKKVIVVDDVVSTGRTMKAVEEIMNMVGAKIVAIMAVLKQGEQKEEFKTPFLFLGKLPLFGA